MFYEYDQNNSGGYFHEFEEDGIGPLVIIEADSASEADERAEEIGLYFDGMGDCSCCGNRWHRQHREGSEVPSYYGTPLDEVVSGPYLSHTFVHYKDGRMEKVAFAN